MFKLTGCQAEKQKKDFHVRILNCGTLPKSDAESEITNRSKEIRQFYES